MSELGDFCVLGGDQCVSVWTQDSNLDSFTASILYTEKDQENQICVVSDTVESLTGQVNQVGVCGSGRMFATLEAEARSVKVWHQEDASLEEPDQDIAVRRYHYA